MFETLKTKLILSWLRGYVKSTENTVDDLVVSIVEDALAGKPFMTIIDAIVDGRVTEIKEQAETELEKNKASAAAILAKVETELNRMKVDAIEIASTVSDKIDHAKDVKEEVKDVVEEVVAVVKRARKARKPRSKKI